MPKRIEKKVLPYTAIQLFHIAINIESYPEFLPWCQATRITQREKDVLIADMKIGYKEFAETYTSKILYTYPTDGIGEIKVSLMKGPFKYLYNYWHFQNINDNESELVFEIDFAFKSVTLDKLINLIFDKAFKKVVQAFENRALTLYK
jgi:coenzyme Q-binding protein COQ10